VHSNVPTSASSSLRLPIDIRRFPWIRRLAADYAYRFDALARFFAGDPASGAAWREAIARAQAHPRDRERMAEVVVAQLEGRGAPAEARRAAARLADPRTVAIVTGQQAGLFGGPLFTLLKAITAIKLAERVERDHGTPAVPIFWTESEDHDWTEVASCAVLDGDMQRRTITLGTPPGAGEQPVAAVRLDPSIFAAVEGLKLMIPGTEFTEELGEALSAAYRPGATMSGAFDQWMDHLLGRLGLVVYDSAEPAAKPLVRAVFARELETAGTTTRLAKEAGEALASLGYHAQAVPHDDNVALFGLDEFRRPIHRREGAFVVGTKEVPAVDLVEAARQHPEGFSPNVLLRPIVQDTLFPTVAYVAGPNELAYLGQLRPVYDHFGVPAPLMYPRASATILDSASAKFLSRYNVDLETLQPGNDAGLNQLLQAQLPAHVEAAFEDASRTVESAMGRLIEAVPAIDPTLEGAARSSLGRMQHDLHTLHEKMIHAAKRRDDTLRRQYARARAQAFPDGEPQERSVGLVYFLNRYGPALVERLHAELPIDIGKHWVITI
jgi:bacillithiol biosynthesis cysteine-adding enzyme BshC